MGVARAKDAFGGPFSPDVVASAIVAAAAKQDIDLTPLQVVKLAYIAHGWWLALTDKPFVDDAVEAWKYGPVFPAIYQMVKKYGRGEIPRDTDFTHDEKGKDALSDAELKFVDSLIDKYGSHSGIELSYLTHKDDTPWKAHYKSGRNTAIPDADIKAHYEKLLQAAG